MKEIEISAVCPVGQHTARLTQTHREFADVLASTGRRVEFIYALDGTRAQAFEELSRLDERRFPVRILQLARGFGEATALQIGIDRARGRLILTLPDRPQIDPSILLEVLDRLDRGDEVVVTRRYPRTDAALNRLQSRVFHWLVRRVAHLDFHDLTCGVRGLTATAARRLDLYGDQHRFIPVLASRCGYRVVELKGAQHPDNQTLRIRRPGVYARRVLDILNIYFLSRFTRKPLRFFGLIGIALGSIGVLVTGVLGIQRLAGMSGLADRPMLLLGVLLIVLGVQVTAIGLLGEIIIFVAERRETPEIREVAHERDTSAAH